MTGIVALLSLTQCTSKHRKVNSKSQPISHQLWDNLVNTHVNPEGNVNYKGFIQDSTKLNEYLELLSNNHPNENNWTKEEQLAYWINAYNAFTVKIIVDNYPVKSIKNIATGLNIPFISSTWDIKFIKIEGQEYDLNNLEHGILRPDFEEPRIHFAINCASVSCPRLRNEAYVAERIDEQLDSAARLFINNTLKNKVSADKLELSKIFSWFKGDFNKIGVIPFINQFTDIEIKKDASVSHLDYDWNLNE